MEGTVGSRIRLVIAESGLTPHAFAKRAEISDTAIRDFMNDRKSPGMKALVSIAEAGDVMLDWLVLGTGVMMRKDAPTVNWLDLIDQDLASLSDEETVELAKVVRSLSRLPAELRKPAMMEFAQRNDERAELAELRAEKEETAPNEPKKRPRGRG